MLQLEETLVVYLPSTVRDAISSLLEKPVTVSKNWEYLAEAIEIPPCDILNKYKTKLSPMKEVLLYCDQNRIKLGRILEEIDKMGREDVKHLILSSEQDIIKNAQEIMYREAMVLHKTKLGKCVKVFVIFDYKHQESVQQNEDKPPEVSQVLQLVHFLRSNGVHTTTDEVTPDRTLPEHIKKYYKEADFILCCCFKDYDLRAKQNKDGEGTNLQKLNDLMIQEHKGYKKTQHWRIIAVCFDGVTHQDLQSKYLKSNLSPTTFIHWPSNYEMLINYLRRSKYYMEH